MKDDKDIWKSSLTDEEKADLFKTKDGGKHAKPLPKKEIFKSSKEKTLEDRVIELEKRVKSLTKIVNKIKPEAERWSDV